MRGYGSRTGSDSRTVVLFLHDVPLRKLVTPSIVLYEVHKRVSQILGTHAAAQADAQLLQTTVVPLDETLAIAAAQVGLSHRLPMADAIIYATATTTGSVLVTSDPHFRALPGVEFIERE